MGSSFWAVAAWLVALPVTVADPLIVTHNPFVSDTCGSQTSEFAHDQLALPRLKTEDDDGRLGARAGCRTDHDCSLNGRCLVQTLTCACRQGWHGSRCENLRTGISARTASIHGIDGHSPAWTWGGSPAVDANGTHHLFFSFLTHGCGLLHYQTNSVVKHAVAETAAGPWHVLPGASLEPRVGFWDSGAIHGPSIVYDNLSQRWLLFYMGTTVTRPRPDCRADPTTPAFMNSSSRRIGLAWSGSITPGEENWRRIGSVGGSDQYESGMILRPRKGKWDSGDVSNAAPLVSYPAIELPALRIVGCRTLPGISIRPCLSSIHRCYQMDR